MGTEKLASTLLGGGLGDALGASIEFDTHSVAPMSFPAVGLVSDDTQMTLFVAEGLVEGDVWAALKCWYTTQAQPFTPGSHGSLANGRLWHHRAPGTTCVGALVSGHAIDDSRGCGGVICAAPCGLWAKSVAEAFELGAWRARLTHAHPDAYLPAAALAMMVFGLTHGQGFWPSLHGAMVKCTGETDRLLARAEMLVDIDEPPELAIPQVLRYSRGRSTAA
jgi:ADP-ribosyl-[dinitrogen reductase] hydrolase